MNENINNDEIIKNICGKYFKPKEFYCKCDSCISNSLLLSAYNGVYKNRECNMKEIFLKKLMIFRLIINIPVIIKSGYRCKNHKKYSSNHNGYASDIYYKEGDITHRMKIISSALKSRFKRIGISKNFIHIDCNPKYGDTVNEEILWLYPGEYVK